MKNNFIKKIVSGGQTGVDRAALDVAIELQIPHGGWCPHGRQAEDGIISMKYNLKTASAPINNTNSDAIYKIRTELNAKDSDGTLIILKGDPIGGTLYTIEMANKHKKPLMIFNQLTNSRVEDIVSWIMQNNIHTLNVAGPRASQIVSIYDTAYIILKQVINHDHLNQNNRILTDRK